jgi:hypothetical protein
MSFSPVHELVEDVAAVVIALALLCRPTEPSAVGIWSLSPMVGIDKLRHRKIRIVRDYGRVDRREAPQYYRDATDRQTCMPSASSLRTMEEWRREKREGQRIVGGLSRIGRGC